MIQLLGLLLLININYIASQSYYGIATLYGQTGLQGYIYFNSTSATSATVTVHITGIQTNPNGSHGINIFTYGDLRGFLISPFDTAGKNVEGVKAFGGLWDPANDGSQGCPETGNANSGNLGNWQATNGVIWESKTLDNIDLSGANSIIGRTVGLYDVDFNCTSFNSNFDSTLIAYGPIGIANVPTGSTNKAAAATGNEKGVCVLVGTGSCTVTCTIENAGFAILTATNDSRIHLTAQVNSIKTVRGIHVHWFGDLNSTDGTSAGGHYNPDAQSHGLPGVNPSRHAGDFGNIQNFDSGFGYYDYAPEYAPTTNNKLDNFIGRAVVIHASFDHGNDPTCSDGATTGAAGARNYFCVIGIANVNNASGSQDQLPEPNLPNNFSQNSTWAQVPCVAAQPGTQPDSQPDSQPGTQPHTIPPELPPSGAQSIFQTIGLALIFLSQIIHL